jgi:hypothetical protein
MPKQDKTVYKKSRGRPTGGKYSGAIPARFEIEAMKSLDAWAKKHAVSRSEAIRRLVELGLKAKPNDRRVQQTRRVVTGTRRGGQEKLKVTEPINPEPGLPDDGERIDHVRLPIRIRRALAIAGLNTVGDVRRVSDAVLLSLPNIGQSSVTHLRNELGRHNRA